MTFPADLILDLHQDGLRVHVNTSKTGDEARLTGPFGEGCSVPFGQIGRLREWLRIVDEAIATR